MRFQAIAVAGLAPRRAARPHHSRKPTRWARLGTYVAMSIGVSPDSRRLSMVDGMVTRMSSGMPMG